MVVDDEDEVMVKDEEEFDEIDISAHDHSHSSTNHVGDEYAGVMRQIK